MKEKCDTMEIKKFLHEKYIWLSSQLKGYSIRSDMAQKVKMINTSSLSDEEIKEIQTHWNAYGIKPNIDSFRWFYNITGQRDWRFIPEDVYAERIIPYMYDGRKAIALDDKNLYNLYFPNTNMPETLVRNMNGIYLDCQYRMITEEEAVNLVINSDKEVVIKPTIGSYKGIGVKLIPSSTITEYLREYKKNFIIQKRVKQHPTFAALNESSTNVVRITTALVNGRVYPLSPTIRVGDVGRFVDQGGPREFCIGIDETGHLKETGLATKSGIQHESKMPNGYCFGGTVLPGFEEMKQLVIDLHPRLAYFPLIGWDLLTDEHNKVVLIECNLNWTGIAKYQECNGPLFGDLTEMILDNFLKDGLNNLY